MKIQQILTEALRRDLSYGNKAYIFSQIGLNANPCSKNCKFCSMAESNYVMDGEFRKTMDDIEELWETVRRDVQNSGAGNTAGGGGHDYSL